jgi:lysophospholipase L1-like esterase
MAALFTLSCSDPALPPTTVIIPPPAVACPVAPPPVTSTNGQSTSVSYGSPTVTGGTAPVSVACVPSSGSAFNVGSTVVTCTATDAVRRTASCSFIVSVVLPAPRLGVTTILAFGDSITEGEVPVFGEFSLRPQYVMPDSSYPAYLTNLLAQRYAAQGASRIDAFSISAMNLMNLCWPNPPAPLTGGIVVINAGCLGERAEDAMTRLQNKLSAYHPDLLLLLEGVNDLDPTDDVTAAASILAGVQGVQKLIAAARSRNVPVIVGTLLPEITVDLTHGGAPLLIAPFNAKLVPAVTSAGARVVDLFSDIATDETDWISPFDGVHPTAAGYQEMARVWFNSIQNAFEVRPVSAGPPLHRTLLPRNRPKS